MNSTTETEPTQSTASMQARQCPQPTANNSPRIQYLLDRIAELKRRAAESPASCGDIQSRLQSYEKSLNDLLRSHQTTNHLENNAENNSDVEPEPLPAGQQPDKGRTDAGQTPDTGRTSSGHSADDSSKLNPLEKQIIEELRQSSQSPLDKLPPETQEQLYDLLARHPITAVQRIISLPAPEGWGVSTSRQSLYRFHERYDEQKRREYRRQQKSVAKAIVQDLDGADEQFTDASERLFKLRLLETANDPASKTRDLRDLFTTLIRLRALSQKTPKDKRHAATKSPS